MTHKGGLSMLDHYLDLIFIISFVGISYYTIWVTVLVFHYIKDPEYDEDFTEIDPDCFIKNFLIRSQKKF